MPKTKEEIDSHCHEYKAAGFPGCIGSYDCVHVRWWACSANLKQFATGKEKYPTRAFEVTVNHRRVILSVTSGFYGSVNDMSIVKFDAAVNSLRREPHFLNYEYELYDCNGDLITEKGNWEICDNGMLKNSTSMNPSKVSVTRHEADWSEMNESLRKDIEDCFGILKTIFSPLKYGLRCHDENQLDDIFKTCCAIYNQRKALDGSDQPWEMEIVDEAEIDGDANQDEPAVFRRNRLLIGGHNDDDNNVAQVVYDEEENESEVSYTQRRSKLITHFKHALSKNEVVWPRQRERGISYTYHA
jgi:hypothetical protein